ncbi:MAG: XRE family transcriptional regulator [Mizugakiibacter sp.]|uniref:LexA family protein n=1 Tax=Mizugakiibacter sp. TaxID=1972610 RepID=UPI00320C68EF
MKEISKWLIAAMERRDNMGQCELARLSGVPQPTIYKILTGETANPRLTTIQKLERALGSKVSGEVLPGPDVFGRIPLIPLSEICALLEGDTKIRILSSTEWRKTTAKVGMMTCAVIFNSDSMEPTIPRNAVVIIEPEEEPTNGRIVVACTQGYPDAIIRRLVIEGGQRYLKPDNDRYPILLADENTRIIGVAVKVELDI